MTSAGQSPRPAIRKPALFAFLLAWFIFFTWDGLRAHFSPDEMMNIDNFYWMPGPWRLFLSQFLVWRGYYRPMGGLFYLPVYAIWGLNPIPYHVFLLAVLFANVWLVFRLARLLGASTLAAGLAALAVSYHAGLSNLYYNTAFVYDALCGLFYCAALVFYLSIRTRGEILTWRQSAIFTLLYLCALNSKEMALTLPVVLLAYEWMTAKQGKLPGVRNLLVFSAVLAAASLWGKIYGVDALTGMEGYRPVFSIGRVHDFQAILFRDIAFVNPGWAGIAIIWALLSYLAWRPEAQRGLRFCWAMLLIAPIPIEFLPGKSQACLYIPMIAAALFAGIVVGSAAEKAADFFSGEAFFHRFHRPVLLAAILMVVVFYWGRANLEKKQHDVKPVMAALGGLTWEVIEQFRALHPQVSAGSHVAFLHDPFTEWDMQFIADLWFHDRSIDVRLQRLNPLPPGELAGAVQFDYQDGRLVRIR